MDASSVFKALVKAINNAQYFTPIFSWVIITYTFLSIGKKRDNSWKYLFLTTSSVFIATFCDILYNVSTNIGINNGFILLTWVEGIFWTLSEWGFIYIILLRIKMYIPNLNKTRWMITMGAILIYNLVIRFRLMYLDYSMKLSKIVDYNDPKNDERVYTKNKDMTYRLLYFPLGLICFIFIGYSIKKFVKEKNKKYRSIPTIFLHNTLFRMSLGIAVIVHFPSEGICGFIRNVLWRIEENLGLVFLIDILLLQMDQDNNKMKKQEEEIKKLKQQMENYGISIRNDDEQEASSISKNKYNSPLDYVYHLTSINHNDHQEIEKSLISPVSLKPNSNPFNNNNINQYGNSQGFLPYLNPSENHVLNSNEAKAIIKNGPLNENNYNFLSLSSPEKPLKSDKRKNSNPSYYMTKPPESLSINNGYKKYNHSNPIFDNEDDDPNYHVHSVLLGNKVYNKLPLAPSPIMTTKTPTTSKYLSTSPISENESFNRSTSMLLSPTKNPGNIIMESNLL
ncbi:hypothetical protein BCR36DRAFT_464119 [Piromyces finnis]|uniref:Uncharacterized protein n=1 Tax=Piromyces finnis TaxID=1754191 RepID=A0A1Y1UW20_9FUNG|nr:hypothetical protein BCR36DRAFT_464119 [Piromyces finnis]|eukprot:ORX42277.1 hypothetical protein BCR36DRAFT_464119 [Piromyces finnis]